MAGSGSPPNPPPAPFPIPSHPSQAELIESYLRPRVLSGEKAGEFIHEADPYSVAPGVLTGRFPSVTAGDGLEAWYFVTKLRRKGNYQDRWNRTVDTGGTWCGNKSVDTVRSGDGPLPIGRCQTFSFATMEGRKLVRSGWIMVELRLNTSDPNALCKVYRYLKAKADGGNPVAAMAGAPGSKEADDEASTAAAGVAVPRRDEDDEEIDAEAVDTGLRLKRKAGDKDSGAETAAASPGREKAAVGDSADAAATGEFCVDAAQEEAPAPAEPEEPDDPSKRKFYTFL